LNILLLSKKFSQPQPGGFLIRNKVLQKETAPAVPTRALLIRTDDTPGLDRNQAIIEAVPQQAVGNVIARWVTHHFDFLFGLFRGR
jgi:hypothetical protein